MIDIRAAEKIRGAGTSEQLRGLAEVATKYELIVILGCDAGRIARVIGDHCPGVTFCIDPFVRNENDTQLANEAKWNLKELIITGRFVLLEMSYIEGFTYLVKQIGTDTIDLLVTTLENTPEHLIEMYAQLLKPEAEGHIMGMSYVQR